MRRRNRQSVVLIGQAACGRLNIAAGHGTRGQGYRAGAGRRVLQWAYLITDSMP